MDGRRGRPAPSSPRGSRRTRPSTSTLCRSSAEKRLSARCPSGLPIAARSTPSTPHPEWREHLAERYDYLETRLEERGATIAAEQPQWAAQLGDVPADDSRRTQWTQLAAEVDVFRERYRVPADAPEAIPAEYRTRPVGADLAARVTELHKSTALRDQPPAAPVDRQQAALAAQQAARRARAAATAPTGQRPAAGAAGDQAARKAAAMEQLRRAGIIKGTPADSAPAGTEAAAKQRQEQEAQRRAAQQRQRERDRDRGREQLGNVLPASAGAANARMERKVPCWARIDFMFERFWFFQARVGLILVGLMFPVAGLLSLALGVVELIHGQAQGVLFIFLGLAFIAVGTFAWTARGTFRPRP